MVPRMSYKTVGLTFNSFSLAPLLLDWTSFDREISQFVPWRMNEDPISSLDDPTSSKKNGDETPMSCHYFQLLSELH
uniref:Uncharacterized protein n=1 Tax=Cucumis sativus TaxID=3659 RepID=A0A0A0K7B7_CUCSA